MAAELAVNGENAMVTVLFADIRDWTRFADSVTAREAVALLVTEANRSMLERENGLVSRGTVELRGKAALVPVYALAGMR
jgi:class 3 adenylate cyclase